MNDGPFGRGRDPRPTSLVQRQELWRLDHGVAARELGGPDGGSADGRLDQLERIATLPTSESRCWELLEPPRVNAVLLAAKRRARSQPRRTRPFSLDERHSPDVWGRLTVLANP